MRLSLVGILWASWVRTGEASFHHAVRTSSVLQQHKIWLPMSLQNSKMASSSSSRPTISSLRGGATKLAAKSPFNNGAMWQSQSIFWGANLLGYGISLVTTSQYHVDLLGTGAFCLAALPTLLSNKNINSPPPPQRVTWSAAAMATWSFKLTSYLLFRIFQSGGHDKRLEGIMDDPYYSAGFWLYSALWGVLVSLPHTLGASSSLPGNPLALRAGAALFGLGFSMETLADYQKWMFKQNHPGQFCNVGLWSLSQHPNWCGNLLLWTGILVMNAPALVGPPVSTSSASKIKGLVQRYGRLALAFVGPLFLYSLFDGQATGRILDDALEATKERYGYGTDPAYTNYIDTTPLIFPKPW